MQRGVLRLVGVGDTVLDVLDPRAVEVTEVLELG